jgi:HNH endonuclease
MSRVPSALRERVRERANGRCEYCRLPERYSPTCFEADHVIPHQHGGPTEFANLAWACFTCNRHRISNLAGIDWETQKRTWLFDPRRQRWHRHFEWRGATLVGKTAVGRATINVLGINLPHQVALRAALLTEGVFFTSERKK